MSAFKLSLMFLVVIVIVLKAACQVAAFLFNILNMKATGYLQVIYYCGVQVTYQTTEGTYHADLIKSH